MLFKMPCSSSDGKIFYRDANIATLGRGSYTDMFDMSVVFGEMNVLGGRFCSLAEEIYFSMGGNHPVKSVTTLPIDVPGIVKSIFGAVRPNLQAVPDVRINRRQIIFGHDVWIARGVTIMGGVKIGNGAVIGAKAVVAKDIPPYAIAVGNPARVVKYRFDAETIKKFLAVKWWNWSLEKIADNFPLMNDVEKFLAAHYSPELENFPEDDFSRQLNAVAVERTYHFVPDFQADSPLWKRVVQEFCRANAENSRLVIWLGKDSTESDFELLAKEAQSFGGDASERIIVAETQGELNFSPRAVRQGTHFITTREMSTLEVMDYLWDTDVKIVSALDNGIFD